MTAYHPSLEPAVLEVDQQRQHLSFFIEHASDMADAMERQGAVLFCDALTAAASHVREAGKAARRAHHVLVTHLGQTGALR